MYSVLYPESNFWWVFRNGSGMVPETFHIYVPGMFLKVFSYLLLPTFFCFGLPFSRENTDKLLIFN